MGMIIPFLCQFIPTQSGSKWLRRIYTRSPAQRGEGYKKTRAFTLIEIIVVLGVLSLVLPVVITIIFTITNQQLKIQRLSQVKREGDFALNVMKSIIRNYGSKLYKDGTTPSNEVCTSTIPLSGTTDGSNFYIKDKFDNNIRFYVDLTTYQIASESALVGPPPSTPTTFLTSTNVLIPNFSISCSRATANSYPVVSIKFTICYKNKTSNICLVEPNRAEEQSVSLDYQTLVKLRN